MKYLQRRRRWLRAQRFWARLRAKREQEYLDAASESEDSSSEDSSSEGSSGSEGDVRAQQRSPRLGDEKQGQSTKAESAMIRPEARLGSATPMGLGGGAEGEAEEMMGGRGVSAKRPVSAGAEGEAA